MRPINLLFFLLAFCVLQFGCRKEQSANIIGTWEVKIWAGSPSTIPRKVQFTADHYLFYENFLQLVNTPYTAEVFDKGNTHQLKINTPQEYARYFFATVSGDELTVAYGTESIDGVTIKCRRVNQ